MLILDRNLILMPFPVITRIFINFRFSNMWKFVTGAKEPLTKKSKKKIAKSSLVMMMRKLFQNQSECDPTEQEVERTRN